MSMAETTSTSNSSGGTGGTKDPKHETASGKDHPPTSDMSITANKTASIAATANMQQSAEQLHDQIDSFLQTNEPTFASVMEATRSFLNTLMASASTDETIRLLLGQSHDKDPTARSFLQSLGTLQSATKTSRSDKQEVGKEQSDPLRRLQVQACLRLEFWIALGEPFRRHYSKVFKKKKKRKGKSKDKVLFDDVVSILSLAAFRLHKGTSFSTFLLECFDPAMLEHTQVGKVLQHFQVSTMESNSDAETEPKPDKTKRRSSPKPEQQSGTSSSTTQPTNAAASKQTSPKTLDDNGKNPNPQSNVSSWHRKDNSSTLILPAKVSLTAPKRSKNSLLAGDKSRSTRFVGSHFNTSLSNMSSLFRQVKVPLRKKTQHPVKQPKRRRRQLLVEVTRPSASTATREQESRLLSGGESNTGGVSRKNCAIVRETPEMSRRAPRLPLASPTRRSDRKRSVQETPRPNKKPKPTQRLRGAFVVHQNSAQLKDGSAADSALGADQNCNAQLLLEAFRSVRRNQHD